MSVSSSANQSSQPTAKESRVLRPTTFCIRDALRALNFFLVSETYFLANLRKDELEDALLLARLKFLSGA